MKWTRKKTWNMKGHLGAMLGLYRHVEELRIGYHRVGYQNMDIKDNYIE